MEKIHCLSSPLISVSDLIPLSPLLSSLSPLLSPPCLSPPFIPLSLPSSHPSVPPLLSSLCLSPPLPCFINSTCALIHLMYFLYFYNFGVMSFKSGVNKDVLCRK